MGPNLACAAVYANRLHRGVRARKLAVSPQDFERGWAKSVQQRGDALRARRKDRVMASFTAPFDPSTVNLVDEIGIPLPPLPPYDDNDALARPGVPAFSARYPEVHVRLLHVTPVVPATLVAPATAAVRIVQLPDPVVQAKLNGLIQLLELSPLPFAMAKPLRKLPGGSPTFYIGCAGALGKDDDLVNGGDTLAAGAIDIYLGVVFQDRVSL